MVVRWFGSGRLFVIGFCNGMIDLWCFDDEGDV